MLDIKEIAEPWSQSAHSLADNLKTSVNSGLQETIVRKRLEAFGLNRLEQAKHVTSLQRFGNQFKSPIVFTLLGATTVSFFIGEKLDASAILLIVIVNAIVGYLQESKAESAIDELSRLAAPKAKVLRSGKIQEISAENVCPGDIIVLEAGDYVPADARLLELRQLNVDEAALTGESLSVQKHADPLPPETVLAERRNMVFAGTAITNGTARAIVTATGMQSEIGKIAEMLESVQTELTPLQARLEQVSKRLLTFCIVIVILVGALNLFYGQPLVSVFMSAISLAVAAIPEGLPAVVTIALALAIRRMARRHAIVRHLPAVETLGSTSVICTDKTGTLTTGKMEIREIYLPAHGVLDLAHWNSLTHEPARDLLQWAALCSNATVQEGQDPIGDSTEVAIVQAHRMAQETSPASQGPRPERLYEWSFDSLRKRMAVAVNLGDRSFLCVKGAPEAILPLCRHSTDLKAGFESCMQQFSSKGRRVLAVALRPLEAHDIPDKEPASDDEAQDNAAKVERDLIFLGLLSMADPPRPEAIEAIRKCHEAGIRVVMITGDHPLTAKAIAAEIGIIQSEGMREVLTGSDLANMATSQLEARVESVAVYARVSPEDKLKIVQAWKARGHVVAMTGDGVNDAPALRQASIGVAMGKGGTEVARQAASMILTDDNFATLSSAVEEGRAVFGNIRRTVLYLLTGNFAEILIMLGAAVMGWPPPLLPIHLLWINLVTDGLPALALASEPLHKDSMSQSDSPSPSTFLNRDFYVSMISIGLLATLMALCFYGYSLKTEGVAVARSDIFTFLVFVELFRSFASRHDTKTFFQVGWRSNVFHLLAVAVPILFQLVLHHTAIFQDIFEVVPISWTDCIAMFTLTLIPVTAIEVQKLFSQRRRKGTSDKRVGTQAY